MSELKNGAWHYKNIHHAINFTRRYIEDYFLQQNLIGWVVGPTGNGESSVMSMNQLPKKKNHANYLIIYIDIRW